MRKLTSFAAGLLFGLGLLLSGMANPAKVIGFLREWLEGRTAVISTHKREVLGLASRAVVLKDGRVVRDGDLMQILNAARANRVQQAPVHVAT